MLISKIRKLLDKRQWLVQNHTVWQQISDPGFFTLCAVLFLIDAAAFTASVFVRAPVTGGKKDAGSSLPTGPNPLLPQPANQRRLFFDSDSGPSVHRLGFLQFITIYMPIEIIQTVFDFLTIPALFRTCDTAWVWQCFWALCCQKVSQLHGDPPNKDTEPVCGQVL